MLFIAGRTVKDHNDETDELKVVIYRAIIIVMWFLLSAGQYNVHKKWT